MRFRILKMIATSVFLTALELCDFRQRKRTWWKTRK